MGPVERKKNERWKDVLRAQANTQGILERRRPEGDLDQDKNAGRAHVLLSLNFQGPEMGLPD